VLKRARRFIPLPIGFIRIISKDGCRLVIHTRQLSANVLNDMLEEMGGVIREDFGVLKELS